ncbi:hypothetical protein K474DRAFT_1680422 [Panus rudis PR-1116 ss-1]|nr:hypothetical protein K474DRAFT_1680422 [Panus rudis PR-1116 ss-1]
MSLEELFAALTLNSPKNMKISLPTPASLHPSDSSPHNILSATRATPELVDQQGVSQMSIQPVYPRGRSDSREHEGRTRSSSAMPTNIIDLPDELLVAIFVFLLEDSMYIVDLSHVCRRFRMVTMHNPLLWKDVDTDSLDCAIAFAQRAQGLPFNMFMKLSSFDVHRLPAVPLQFRGLWSTEFRHLTKLHLSTSYDVMHAISKSLPHHFPLLECLGLCVDNDKLHAAGYPPMPIIDFFPAADASVMMPIRELTLMNVLLHTSSARTRSLCNLHELEFSVHAASMNRFHDSNRPLIDRFLDLLEDCPNLHTLLVEYIGSDRTPVPMTRSKAIPLLHLQDVIFEGTPLDILPHITMPSDTSVEYDPREDDKTIASRLISHRAWHKMTKMWFEFIRLPNSHHLAFGVFGPDDVAPCQVPGEVYYLATLRSRIDWDDGLPTLSPSRIALAMGQLGARLQELYIEQTGSLNVECWSQVLARGTQVHYLTITNYYKPGSVPGSLESPGDFTPFFEALYVHIAKGGRSSLKNVCFSGFPSNAKTVFRTRRWLSCMKKHGGIPSDLTLYIVQRSSAECQLSPSDFTSFEKDFGIEVYCGIEPLHRLETFTPDYPFPEDD